MPGRERGLRSTRRSNPLGEDLHADRFASAKRDAQADEAAEDERGLAAVLPGRTTKRILRTARQQLDALADDEEALVAAASSDGDEDMGGDEVAGLAGPREAFGGNEENEGGDDDEEVIIEYDDAESIVSEMPSEMDAGMDMYGIDDEEARLLQKFQPPSRVQSRNLADMIMEKIREKEGGARAAASGEAEADSAKGVDEERIDPRVTRVYTAIGAILKNYTSGKIPKAFKVLPNIKNWEQLLMLTKPHEWSPHATYQATRIFAANLNERMAQRFYAAVLLPMVHERMAEDKKLHPALYMAIRKALFKPVAFFKGFIVPLAADDECTLKEALVVASVLQRTHLPPVPTAVTIVKLAQQSFSGPRSVFLRVLIDKKMAMPYQAIDALVAYFHGFIRTHAKEEKLPVLWHQTLLSFVQRYRKDFTAAQVELLQQVCARHFHYMLTPEVRRELSAAKRT